MAEKNIMEALRALIETYSRAEGDTVPAPGGELEISKSESPAEESKENADVPAGTGREVVTEDVSASEKTEIIAPTNDIGAVIATPADAVAENITMRFGAIESQIQALSNRLTSLESAYNNFTMRFSETVSDMENITSIPINQARKVLNIDAISNL